MFTSGSTGLPKVRCGCNTHLTSELIHPMQGVMMSHRNLVAGATGIVTAIPAVSHEDVYLGYLPLAHVLEMLAEMAIISVGGSIGYGTPKTVTDNSPGIPRDAKGNPRCRGDAPLLRPTILAAVPAVMNKIRGTISSRVEKAGGLKKVLFNVSIFRCTSSRWNVYYHDGLDLAVGIQCQGQSIEKGRKHPVLGPPVVR